MSGAPERPETAPTRARGWTDPRALPGGETVPVAERTNVAPTGAFLSILAVLLVDYGRPQDLITPLQALPVGILVLVPVFFYLVREHGRVPWRDPLLRWYLLLVVFAALWAPLATNRYWAFQCFKLFIVYGSLMSAVLAFVDTPERMRRLLAFWVAVLIVQAVWGIGHEGSGIGAFYADQNDFAVAMGVGIPFALAGFSRTRNRGPRLLYGVCVVLFLAGIVVSDSRGGLVGLAGLAGVLTLMSRHRLAIIVTVIVAGLVIAVAAPTEYWEDMATMFDPQDDTRLERLRHWQGATTAWLANPWFGIGPGNIPWVIGIYESYDPFRQYSLAGRAVHSLYFTLLPEWGVVGIGIYLGLIGSAMRRGWRVVRAAGPGVDPFFDTTVRAVICALAMYFVGGIFISVLYYPHLYYLLAIVAATHRLAIRAHEAPAPV